MAICAEPGCAEIVKRGYCPTHRRRGSPSDKATSQRAHKRRRAELLRRPGPLICHICTQPILDVNDMHADHIVALSRGGPDTLANLAPAHRRCNLAKNDR